MVASDTVCTPWHSHGTAFCELEIEPYLSMETSLSLRGYSICQTFCFWITLAACHRMSKDVLWLKNLNFSEKRSEFSHLGLGKKSKSKLICILSLIHGRPLPIFKLWFINCVWSENLINVLSLVCLKSARAYQMCMRFGSLHRAEAFPWRCRALYL